MMPLPQPIAAPLPGSADGLVLKPILVAPDDTKEMLDIRLWKFNLHSSQPVGNSVLGYSLELRQQGQVPVVLARSFFPSLRDDECALGLMPVDGESLRKADNIKIYFRRGNNFRFGGRIIANPMKALNYSAWKTNPELHLSPEGEAVLMEFSDGRDINSPWTQLVMVLHTGKELSPFMFDPSTLAQPKPPSPSLPPSKSKGGARLRLLKSN